jgi:myo-inositol-1(or 4)-monophosphatase
VDLKAQEAALKVILDRHPDHRVLAEEEGSLAPGNHLEAVWPSEGEYLWVVDPLDGTTNYLHRHPFFSASVGVGRRGPGTGAGGLAGLEAGAVVAPMTGERWWARREGGAFKDGGRIHVSSNRSMARALIGTGFPFKAPDLVSRYIQELGRVLPASGGVRRAGSAAIDLCYLAEGILDGFWEEEYLSPWDVAAGVLILQEAGGVATRLDGSALSLEKGSVLAANGPELLGDLGRLVTG